MGTPERVQKLLARAGVGSRRAAEEMIASGRVTVNGEVAELGRKADPETDRIEVDSALIGVKADTVWYALNKPAGVLSTALDPQGRRTVVDMVPTDPRVYPVGRLDADTEGLLLLTNDGDVTFRLTHPSYGVEKEYMAHLQGDPSRGALRQLREGVELDDGLTAPARVSVVSPSVIRLVIHEGRNRQVRRMCEAIGHPVLRLVRTRVGPFRDPDLAPGDWRQLETKEILALELAARRRSGDDATPAG